MEDQRKELAFTYNNWRGIQDQIDDVCVVGVLI